MAPIIDCWSRVLELFRAHGRDIFFAVVEAALIFQIVAGVKAARFDIADHEYDKNPPQWITRTANPIRYYLWIVFIIAMMLFGGWLFYPDAALWATAAQLLRQR